MGPAANVATAIAHHRADALHPFGGSLGWLAGHPDHAGKGLGMAVSAAVVRRLLEAGLQEYLPQHRRLRLAALSIYLKLGWVPLLYMSDMEERWRDVCAQARLAVYAQGVARRPHVACLNSFSHHGAVGGIAIMAGNPNSGHIDLRERGIDENLAAELRARFATSPKTGMRLKWRYMTDGKQAIPTHPHRDKEVG